MLKLGGKERSEQLLHTGKNNKTVTMALNDVKARTGQHRQSERQTE